MQGSAASLLACHLQDLQEEIQHTMQMQHLDRKLPSYLLAFKYNHRLSVDYARLPKEAYHKYNSNAVRWACRGVNET
eukprot:2503781-Amphidinium_carterae.1